MNPNKVQKIKITQNYFQKKLDVTTIGVHQASSDVEKVKEKDYSFGSIIRIFDWNGSIGLELHSDINLRRITVSEDNQYIYAIAKDKDDFTCVVVFYIGDIIKDLI